VPLVAESAKPAVAVLGTGIMGAGMTRSALRAGLPVRAWNRTRQRAEPLSEDGAEVVDSVAQAVEGADLVVTMLSDGDAVLAVAEGALEAAGEDVLWLQMSTIGIASHERCAELAARHGVELVDAPVVGTKQPAEQGKLTVLASGPDAARGRCEPLFDAVGQRTVWLGAAGAGTRLKLVINSWIVSLIEGLAETLATADALDVDKRQFLEAIEGGPLDLPYAQLKGGMMIERSFDPQFTLELAAKDARLAVEALAAHGLDLPLPRAIAARLQEGVAAGHGGEDMAATYLTSLPRR
jgi:3-hydroxyisobutyrate dehydrogenase